MLKKIIITLVILLLAIGATAYIYKHPNIMNSMNDTEKIDDIKDVDADRAAQVGDLVVVNYTGTLENGTKFDSSYDRGEPIGFLLGKGMVIQGWDEGIVGMKAGDKKNLVIPGEKAYGDQEIPGPDGKILIPKNATLIFDIEVVQVMSAERVEELMQKQQQAMMEAQQAAGTSTTQN